MKNNNVVRYTVSDESSRLAAFSLHPILKNFGGPGGVDFIPEDISLANRILSRFPKCWKLGQQFVDHLAELGELVKRPEANIIKLPNISASLPQLIAAIKELQEQGFPVPEYGSDTKALYEEVIGSVANPLLREGSSDRRTPLSVKRFAERNPHKLKKFPKNSKSCVVSMKEGDFLGNEKSITIDKAQKLKIEFVPTCGVAKILKDKIPVGVGDVIDATRMNVESLRLFLKDQMRVAKDKGILWSLQVKATMMKISDPIIFGHALSVLLQDVFETHGEMLTKAGVNPNDGLGSLYEALKTLPDKDRKQIERDIETAIEQGPSLAMVDASEGITGIHSPNDVIIDANIPAAFKNGGQMWNSVDNLQDAMIVIPDGSYAGVYDSMLRNFQRHGPINVKTVGNVSNVGLMAFGAEEYGSHKTTYEIESDGVVKVTDGDGNIIFQHEVKAGDIWRQCKTKVQAIDDWIKLAIIRQQKEKVLGVFWLDESRPHDFELIKKVRDHLTKHNIPGDQLRIMRPVDATKNMLDRMRAGLDTISITGNVLRDYLTDWCPIMIVGTSAKMLSIIPLIAGGGLFETGAGGSHPKGYRQLMQEGHLRWDSTGEFLAIAESLRLVGELDKNNKAIVLADALDVAIGKMFDNDKTPKEDVYKLDTISSHFYLAWYWAQALALQNDNSDLKEKFIDIAEKLSSNEETIMKELNVNQGKAIDLGGYYFPNIRLVKAAMQPSDMFNEIIRSINR